MRRSLIVRLQSSGLMDGCFALFGAILGFFPGDAHVRPKIIERYLAAAISRSSHERKVRLRRGTELHGCSESVSSILGQESSCRRLRAVLGCRVLSNGSSFLPEIPKAAWSNIRWATQTTSLCHPHADACGSWAVAHLSGADHRVRGS